MVEQSLVARLVFVSGPEDGKEIQAPIPAIFGRLAENEVPLQYDYLSSRRHACLSHDGETFILEDLGSRNGTFLLTGEPVHSPLPIESGAVFKVGGVWLKLLGD
ncbi:MAG: FHA domain-containing protein [Acidobacteria bacterium]|nr:FHA domain-containing protein [Acidobacteriota bacterium]